MRRVCNTCGGLGWISYSLGHTEQSCPCTACSPMPRPDNNGVTVRAASDLQEVPRYTLRRNMEVEQGQPTRWIDVLHSANPVAIGNKIDELRAKGTANWQMLVVDNWS